MISSFFETPAQELTEFFLILRRQLPELFQQEPFVRCNGKCGGAAEEPVGTDLQRRGNALDFIVFGTVFAGKAV